MQGTHSTYKKWMYVDWFFFDFVCLVGFFFPEENIYVAWQNSSDPSSSLRSTCMYEEKTF